MNITSRFIAAAWMAALIGPYAAMAAPVDDLLRSYQAAGAGPFSAAKGERMWSEAHTSPEGGEPRRCTTCHGADLTKPGKHATTGKAIEPLAPSANGERLTDVKFMEKWLLRNCKWVLGRECTPQEKGDFLAFIRTR